jgi:hypothetical protein
MFSPLKGFGRESRPDGFTQPGVLIRVGQREDLDGSVCPVPEVRGMFKADASIGALLVYAVPDARASEAKFVGGDADD